MIQYIDRKTVLNLVYTQQATRMADAYETLLADFSQMTAWGRGLESDLSHARVEISFLKAEVERLRASSFVTAVPVEEYEKLKAEVERLTKAHSDALADFWAIHKGYFDLKAEVEQLRKEGKQP